MELEACRPEAEVFVPYKEFKVEEDLVVGIVPPLPLLPSLDSVDRFVRKLDLERRRNSLKKEGAISKPCSECRPAL